MLPARRRKALVDGLPIRLLWNECHFHVYWPYCAEQDPAVPLEAQPDEHALYAAAGEWLEHATVGRCRLLHVPPKDFYHGLRVMIWECCILSRDIKRLQLYHKLRHAQMILI